ncbi:hypothetical protein ACFSKW_54875 [Nonomuraea mangrovi]|uniref:Uncharacterized protein n=1 Tax=Nonomuraea mangrovi TaxID=2316207 RepID=A0ABW4THN3_9ACTN
MRHMLLPAAATLLWVINVAYVAAIPQWPHLGDYDAGQLLLVGIAITVTIAWLLHRQGIEYRIGYRHGQDDQRR